MLDLCAFRSGPTRVRVIHLAADERNDALIVAAAPGALLRHLVLFDEGAVDKHVDQGQERTRGDFLKRASRPSPDGLLGKAPANRRQKLHERFFVLGLKGIAPEERKARHPLRIERLQDLFGRLVGKGLTGFEVPALLVKAAAAVHRAAGNEKRNAHAGTVGGVVFAQTDVVHDESKSQRN